MFTLQSVTESICFTSESSKITPILIPVLLSPQFLRHLEVFLVSCFGKILESLSKILSFLTPCLSHVHFFDFGCCFLQKHSFLSRALSLQVHQEAAPRFHSHGHFQWYSKVTKPKFHRQFPQQNQAEQTHTFFSLPFLTHSCWFNACSALTEFIPPCASSSTPATCLSKAQGARASTESPVPPPIPAAAILPHLRFVQNIVSSSSAAHSQHLHFSVTFYSYFFPPSPSLLSSSYVSGVSLGKTLNLKGLLNNLAQPCTQEIKPFCTFSVYHCVLQSKVLIHT